MLSRCASALIALALLISVHASAYADEAAIRASIKEFFATADAAKRHDLAGQIEADPAYDRAKLSQCLHSAGLFKPMDAGRHNIQSGPGTTKTLSITLRIPSHYDPNRAYPLIYALHGTGGDADGILNYIEKLLGPRVDEYILAAPNAYEQVVLHSSVPYSVEHRAALADIRKAVHIDANRQYAIGYSRGGHACWTLAVTCGDEFAGIISLAGTFLIPEYDVLFETFLPNIASTAVLCCYGGLDDAGPDGGKSSDGGIAGVNRFLRKIAEPLKLPLTLVEDADKGHGGIVPTREALAAILEQRRNPWPSKVAQTFRMIDQCAAHWVEPTDWASGQWDEKPVTIEYKPGEKDWDKATQRKALGRAIRGLLGFVKAEAKGQSIRIDRKNIKGFRLWLSEPLVRLDQEIVVNDSGKKVYSGVIRPNLELCLTQAASSYDFDRLRWAGLAVSSGKKPEPLTVNQPERP